MSLSRLADLLDPPSPPSPFEALGYEPNCRLREEARKEARPLPLPCGECPQEQFHAATEDRVVYGGAAGGGKTKALVMEAIRLAVTYPGLNGLILRESFPQLRLNIEKELAKVNYCVALGARFNATNYVLRFPNGSEVHLGYLDDRKAAARYQGAEFQVILVDELTLIPAGLVEVVLERLRSGNPRVPVIGFRATCNPGGASHGEVKGRYIDATERGERVVTDEVGRTLRFIPAKVTDNPRVNDAYLRDLMGIPDPQRRAAMLDGSWDQFEGQVFTEWRHDRHVVRPFRVPDEWTRYAGLDFGLNDPSVCLWGAEHDGRIVVYRELTQRGVWYAEQGRNVLRLEQEGSPAGEGPEPSDRFGPLTMRYADPSAWNRTTETGSYADDYATAGVHLNKASTRAREYGWGKVHEYLADALACPTHHAMWERGEWPHVDAEGRPVCPRLHVFESCRDLIRSIPSVTYSSAPTKPEDVDTHHPDDHWLDALRYLLVSVAATSGPTLAEMWNR